MCDVIIPELTHLGKSFVLIKDSIPPMMNALRMVWIISRHFNRDEQMVPLMERIAWQLAQKVQATLNIKFLFQNRSPQTLVTVKQVCCMFHTCCCCLFLC